VRLELLHDRLGRELRQDRGPVEPACVATFLPARSLYDWIALLFALTSTPACEV
jgi:hypothetical protein